MQEKSAANHAGNRASFAQAQKSYQSKLKFGKSSTRQGGLSDAQIGEAPTMKPSSSKGFMGNYERAFDPTLQGMSLQDRRQGEQDRRRANLGFGGGSSQLG